MTTRQTVINLLRGKEARRIRFTFPASGGNITIDSLTFHRVAQAIENGGLTLTIQTNFPDGVGAQYDGGSNTILTPPVHGRADALLLIHECTHASFDIDRIAISATDDEAAAYVVGALYGRMTGLTPERWTPNTRRARPVAEGLLRQYQAGTHGVPSVDASTWSDLRWVIMMHPIYIEGPAGLPAQIFPGANDRYTHDG